jgi:hypothetical protein
VVTISGDGALAEFRARLTGRYGLDLVRQHGGGVLVQHQVGVGKSFWLDAITVEAVQGGDYDLAVVLCPTRQLIRERGPVRKPPRGVRVINLRPRPARRCGRERDAQWRRYEAADLGALGRAEVCGACPLRGGCFWPGQYGARLRRARIVYATQAHLERSPNFLLSLRSWAGAERVLTLLDEANFVGGSFARRIPAESLALFAGALRRAGQSAGGAAPRHEKWLALVGALRGASTADLQEVGWRVPWPGPRWAAAVQRVGVQLYGDAFRFLGYDLTQFAASPVETRRRDEAGGIQFSVRPYVGDCIVFTGTTDRGFACYRLGKDLASPFADHRFRHPGTRWYNLASPIGSRRYFARHSPQVLDFFAQLVARRTAEGKRVLLVAKKCFLRLCAVGLAERFAHAGVALRAVTGGWSEALLADPGVVPLINYGMIGTNRFEHFDVVYCLTGYYVNEHVVNQCLQDLTRQDLRLPVRIETTGHPRRRRARLAEPEHRYYDLAPLVQPALEFREHGVVIQAVGRVRPFTRPREVITFQMAELPGVAYDAEFSTLAEARRHFGIACGRDCKSAALAARIGRLRRNGSTQAEVARLLGISERTVRNYDKQNDRKKSI